MRAGSGAEGSHERACETETESVLVRAAGELTCSALGVPDGGDECRSSSGDAQQRRWQIECRGDNSGKQGVKDPGHWPGLAREQSRGKNGHRGCRGN